MSAPPPNRGSACHVIRRHPGIRTKIHTEQPRVELSWWFQTGQVMRLFPRNHAELFLSHHLIGVAI